MWKENSEFLNGPSPIGVRKALARLIPTFGRRIFYERDVLEAYIASGRIHTSESSKC